MEPAHRDIFQPRIGWGTCGSETVQSTGRNEMVRDRALVRMITDCPTFRQYQRAFRKVTGLPLSFQPVNDFAIAHDGDPNQSPFCALLVRHNSTCAETLRFQSALQQKASSGPATVSSRYGVRQTAVPVKIGERLIGHLHTGQVFFHRPTHEQIGNAFRRLRRFGVRISAGEFHRAFKGTHVLERQVYDAIIGLLQFFAAQIGTLANHIVVEQTETVPVHVAQARRFIAEHFDEQLSLSHLARHLEMSPFVLCKLFKRATGVNFKDYVARVRVEKAKDLLASPRYRISEAAYGAGFQSLSNFNRHFRRIVGLSPTGYRQRVRRLTRSVTADGFAFVKTCK